ncbi:MAG: hypothetical protein HYR89_05255 [Actinobacteria bacterium]|nr:hypothetical protein [Actinomycetota bacterium]
MAAAGAAFLASVLGACASGDQGMQVQVRADTSVIATTTTTVVPEVTASEPPVTAEAPSRPATATATTAVPATTADAPVPRSSGRVSGMLHVAAGNTMAYVVLEREDGTPVGRYETGATSPFAFDGLGAGTYRLRNGGETTPVTDETGVSLASQWTARSELFNLADGQSAAFACGPDQQSCTPA